MNIECAMLEPGYVRVGVLGEQLWLPKSMVRDLKLEKQGNRVVFPKMSEAAAQRVLNILRRHEHHAVQLSPSEQEELTLAWQALRH